MASGRSQLGADIHEIDNAASRCGRLLDEVAGDAEAVADRRDEIIAAMADDRQAVLRRRRRDDLPAVAASLRRAGHRRRRFAPPTPQAADSPWLDITWRDRFAEMLQRAEARLQPGRLRPDRHPVRATPTASAAGEPARGASPPLLARYPDAETVMLHPADVPFFITLCKTLGKPVNFVPVIDKDVRRWWRSDSLWQAHDARYTADQVCIIPGTAAVAGITRVDEPVGELLDRFEQAAVDEVLGRRRRARRRSSSRLQVRTDVSGPLAIVLDAPDVLWAGRTATNPVHRIGDPAEWQVHDEPTAAHTRPVHRCTARGRCRRRGRAERPAVRHLDRHHVHAAAPPRSTAARRWSPPRTPPPRCAPCWPSPRVSTGPERCPRCVDGTATVTVDWDPERIADHTGVTATFGAPLAPDADRRARRARRPLLARGVRRPRRGGHRRRLPGHRGPADLVHLDHAAQLLGALPDGAGPN